MEDYGSFKVLITFQNLNVESMPIIKNLSGEDLLKYLNIDTENGFHDVTQKVFSHSMDARVKVRVVCTDGPRSGREETVVLKRKDYQERTLYSFNLRPILDQVYDNKIREAA